VSLSVKEPLGVDVVTRKPRPILATELPIASVATTALLLHISPP